jgi:hypothetical protein
LKDRKEEDQVKMNAEAWDIWLPKYIDRLTKEVEGKIDLPVANSERVKVMNANNPR